MVALHLTGRGGPALDHASEGGWASKCLDDVGDRMHDSDIYRNSVGNVNRTPVATIGTISGMERPGDRLRRARIRARFKSAAAAARRHGWPISTYASHENGQTDPPPVEDVLQYAEAFKVSPAWILFEVGTEDDPGLDVLLRGRTPEEKERAKQMLKLAFPPSE